MAIWLSCQCCEKVGNLSIILDKEKNQKKLFNVYKAGMFCWENGFQAFKS